VTLGQYFGGGLLALGVGLVVGAWWGRARLRVLVGLAVLPLAVTAAFVTVPLAGDPGPAFIVAFGRPAHIQVANRFS